MKLENPVVDEITAALAAIPGMVAVGLGGSWARGRAKADSDVDLGLYYDGERPFRLDDVRAVAERFAIAPTTVTQFYEWGPWVNGGAWLETRAGRVDFIYREVAHLHRVIEAAQRGESEWHFAQQPPYGFRSVIYLAETAVCVPLHDPNGALARLKQSVDVYPEALRTTIVRASLWSCEFTLFNARKLAARGDVYGTAGCLTRIACELVQALFALNRVYFITDKDAWQDIDAFALRPDGIGAEIGSILGAMSDVSASVARMGVVVREVIHLNGGLYEARFALPSQQDEQR